MGEVEKELQSIPSGKIKRANLPSGPKLRHQRLGMEYSLADTRKDTKQRKIAVP